MVIDKNQLRYINNENAISSEDDTPSEICNRRVVTCRDRHRIASNSMDIL